MRWLLVLGTLASCKVQPAPDGLLDGACPAIAADAGDRGFASVPLTWTFDADVGGWVAAPVQVSLPDDVQGVSVTADAGEVATAILRAQIDGRVVLDARRGKVLGGRAAVRTNAEGDSAWDTFSDTAWDTAAAVGFPGFGVAPFFHLPMVAGTLQLPMNAATRPWGGCMEVTAVAVDDPGASATLRFGLQRRRSDAGVLDLNVVVLDGTRISENELSQALGVVASVYAGAGGPGLGTVRTFTLDAGTARPRLRDLGPLRAAELPGAPIGATTILFADGFTGSPGTLGLAAAIPGPAGIPSTGSSGVSLNLGAHRNARDQLDLRLLGETLAHELGHQLGLFHTTEADGRTFDVLDDTPTCDAATFDGDRDGSLSAEECVARDGANLMFWVAGSYSQDQLSPGQVDVLVRSPATGRTP